MYLLHIFVSVAIVRKEGNVMYMVAAGSISKAPITNYFYIVEKVLIALIVSKFSYFK